MKFLKLLFILIFILFPFGELLRFEIGNNIAIKPLDIAVGLAAANWLVLTLFKKHKPKLIHWLFLAFPLIGFLSLIISSNWLKPHEFLTSFLYLVRWVSYASIFFIVMGFDRSFKKIIWFIMIFDGLIILLVGFIQYYFYSSLKSLYYLGWDEHLHRMFSVFLDPNYAGSFFVLYFLFNGGLLYKSIIKAKENKPASKNLNNYLLSIILFLTLIAIFLTFSRSAILMLITGSITFCILIKRKKFVIFVLTAILLFGITASPKFYDENMNIFRQNSSEARIDNYITALTIIRDHPLVGVGFNSYRYTKELYGLDHDWVDAPSHADAGVDNSLLFVLATTGIIGLTAYLGIWRVIINKSWHYYTKKRSSIAIVVIASGTGILINSFFINSLFFAPLMLWMWAVIGLMED